MNMVKKTALSASVLLAMAFTFGCSDDKDDPPSPKWCVIETSIADLDMSSKACFEIGWVNPVSDKEFKAENCVGGSVGNAIDTASLVEDRPADCNSCRSESLSLGCEDKE